MKKVGNGLGVKACAAIILGCWLGGALYAQAYRERYRPQFHFSPRVNWTNDPNGLVYLNGTYHLFFQHNPFGDVWGHMSWGHATSTDLVHWQEQPVALREESGVMIFTGSTVVDRENTSGLCRGNQACLVAIYTGHSTKLQTQNLAYSEDGGRTWIKYSRNPVLDLHLPEFRDPKVFWRDASKQWVMAVSLSNDHKIRLYGSPNLKEWTRLSEFGPEGAAGGQWECPELFELPVDGNANQKRWVLKVGLNPGGLQGGSGEQYFIGRFDGQRFVNDNPAALTLWTDYGKDCYCALTFNNLRADQPAVTIGWMNNWQYANRTPTSPWRGQMTIPREVSLRRYPEGIRLVQQPVKALEQLRTRHLTYPNLSGTGQAFEMTSTIRIGGASEAGWKILANDGTFTAIGYDARAGRIFVDRTHSGDVGFSDKFPARTSAPLRPGDLLRWRVLVDQSSVEVFAGDGQTTLTNLVYPPLNAAGIEFYSMSGKAAVVAADVWPLKSIW